MMFVDGHSTCVLYAPHESHASGRDFMFLSFIHVEEKSKLTIKIGLVNFAFLHDANCSNQYQNDEISKLQSTIGIVNTSISTGLLLCQNG